ncbi:MAG: aspartate/glutamate racemase family protein [Flavobacteriaceae bacterium]|nr:aspartate/glutamate racemase family protein [Flavobacteriaceae bacterium]
MQTIGLIGGITPQSTIMYYQVLNDLAAQTFGGIHSSKLIINSLDFGEISRLQSQGRWDKLDTIMQDAALGLEKSGASMIVICANTMHLCVEAIKQVVSIPVIHIAEATVKRILDQNISKVALLGTKYTMEKPFFKEVLKTFGIETIIPDEKDRDTIHKVIYDELSKGLLLNTSKEAYLKIIEKLVSEGAEGIILGCTEIPLLIKQDNVSVPVFDTTTIHATAAFELAHKSIKIV